MTTYARTRFVLRYSPSVRAMMIAMPRLTARDLANVFAAAYRQLGLTHIAA